jgi:hypothetical protein
LALLFYGYATGIVSSRQSERATYALIPVVYSTGGPHPDPDSITTFRHRWLRPLAPLFVQRLRIAPGLGIVTLGDVSLDGTNIQAQASQPQARRGAYAEQLAERLRADGQTWWQRAATEAGAGSQASDLPAEVKRRADRWQTIAAVPAASERRAPARYAPAPADSAATQAARATQERARGRTLGGQQPQEPTPGPRPPEQVQLTDADWRIRPVAGGGG